MHAFPGDLAEDAEQIGTLLADHDVTCVDTGHTHYNEVLNDGRVIYAATRSTGQIEEGPLGFSLHAVDGSVVSWRFRTLDRSWPFVLITSPADERLITDPTKADQTLAGPFSVRAKVFGAGVGDVRLSVDGDKPQPLEKDGSASAVWTRAVPELGEGRHQIRVQATGPDGFEDADAITVLVSAQTASVRPPAKDKPGHDVHTVGAWPERGLLGTQLGPNKNGKKW
jgi:hypothetical protein